LSGLQPEGIAEVPPLPWAADTSIQLISDNGTLVPYDDGIQNKHLLIPEFKRFRSDWVTLGTVVKPIPIITSTAVSNAHINVTWRALERETYRVQFKQALTNPDWTDVTSEMMATGPFVSAEIARTVESMGFYRVVLVGGTP
jgi:hypothetical protein